MLLFWRQSKRYKWLLRADVAECFREDNQSDLVISRVLLNSESNQVRLGECSDREMTDLIEPVVRVSLDMDDVEGKRVGTPIGFFRVLLQLVLWQYTTKDRLVSFERVWGLPAYLRVLPQLKEIEDHLKRLQPHEVINDRRNSLTRQIIMLEVDRDKLVYPAVNAAVNELVTRERQVISQREMSKQHQQNIELDIAEGLAEIFSDETRRIHDTTQLLITRYSQ